jgi:hypothetical protein
MEAWTLLDKRANYILQKTIRMQIEEDNLVENLQCTTEAW